MKIKRFTAIAVFVTAVLSFGQNTGAVTVEELLAQIAQLQAQIVALQAQQQTQTQTQTQTWCHTFNANMGYRATGADFEALITALDKEGIMEFTSANEPSEYNEVIGSGVVEFQEKYAPEVLNPYGLKNGTGYVGKSTRAKLNALYGCSTQPIACTQDVKLCLDGTYVSRIGANCEFADCPTSPTKPVITVTSPNGGETWQIGSLQKVSWTSNNIPTSNMTEVSLTDLNNNIAINLTTVANQNGQAYFVLPSTVAPGQYKAHVKTAVNGVSYIDTGDGYITVSSATSTCTPSWTCGSWNTCSNNQQTRVCLDSNSCGVTTDKPATIQTCTSSCTPSWTCGSWNTCSNNQQTRVCLDSNSCGVTIDKPATIQTCTSSCTPSWTCYSWSICANNQQTRTCWDVNNCGVTINKPAVTQTCTSSCTPSWTCGSWNTCSNNQQTRVCLDSNSCGVTTDKPVETQVCGTPCITASPTTGTLTGSSPTLWVDFVVSNYIPNGTEKVDFGDGTVSILGYTTIYNTRHDYHSAGTYTAKLLADTTILATTQVTVSSSDTPSITVTSTGGSDIPGHNLTFSWTASGVSTVDLSLKNSSNTYALANGVSASAGSYSVRIPADAVLGTYSMVVSSGSIIAYGGQFSIVAPTAATITVTSPNGGELWIVENLQTVRFMNTGITGTAWIYLDKYSGSTRTKSFLVGAFPISTSKQSEVHSFNLSRSLINSMGGPGNFKIRVLSNASGTPQDTSDNYFTIADPLASSDISQGNLASISDAVAKLAEQIKSLLSK